LEEINLEKIDLTKNTFAAALGVPEQKILEIIEELPSRPKEAFDKILREYHELSVDNFAKALSNNTSYLEAAVWLFRQIKKKKIVTLREFIFTCVALRVLHIATILMKEIDLNKIDHTKEKINEVIGLKPTDFDCCMDFLLSQYTLRDFFDFLRKNAFSSVEIVEAILSTTRMSLAITNLWRSKGREKISTEEFLLTFIYLRSFVFGIPLLMEIVKFDYPLRMPNS